MTGRIHDVAIVGGGIGGTTLATILARHGVDVLLVEGGTHPRFAIGESTIPETTFGLRVLASRYDVPELKHLSTYGGLRRHVSTTCGVKRNFSFVHHTEGERSRGDRTSQLATWAPPLGPDSHYFRQDLDAYLFGLALSYGAEVRMQTLVSEVDIDGDGVTLTTSTGEQLRSRYVVDAGGIRAVVAERLGLRDETPRFKTRSRSIFTHMVDVLPFDQVGPSRKEHGLDIPFAQGTLHHMFRGGWMWVIPFDNHPDSTNRLCSVGVNLRLDEFPVRPGVSPEEEFWDIVRRFPDIERQLRHARAVRPWTGSQRNQFSSHDMVGDRYCLLPHASDFVDPLFSSGLSVTVMAINALAHRLVDAARTGDFSTEKFRYVEEWTHRAFDNYDDLVGCSYAAFADFDVWNAWHRIWMLGSLYGTNGQNEAAARFEASKDPAEFMRLERPPYRGLQGLDNPVMAELFRSAVAEVRAFDAGVQSKEVTVSRIYEHLRNSRLAPSTWKILDPANRCPAGPLTPHRILRVVLWGRTAAPPHVKGTYFTGGIRVASGETARFVAEEVARAGRGLRDSLRDLVLPWNRDWKHRYGAVAADAPVRPPVRPQAPPVEPAASVEPAEPAAPEAQRVPEPGLAAAGGRRRVS